MISLAKLRSTGAGCFDLLSCIFDIGPSEFQVFMEMRTGQWIDLDTVAASLNKSRTSVFKALQRLVSLGLVYREARNVRSGGQYHVYSMADRKIIKKIAQERVSEIEISLKSLVDRLDVELEQKCGISVTKVQDLRL
ncbi:MAG: hypothetical protein M1151_00590 [Candidatus Thermoplasmatota archaeon]|nr:hypothetical protein [Candidatus Thermoplasmatota archaeon]MCL5785151.1 hypothetical protein [Candidatus Thermoplasmatota archaeon]